jgi:hypothetical protein
MDTNGHSANDKRQWSTHHTGIHWLWVALITALLLTLWPRPVKPGAGHLPQDASNSGSSSAGQ